MADDGTFADLYARYHRRVRGYAYALWPRDADDVAQEAMLRAWASYRCLDATRDPWPWLAAIVRNVVRDRAARADAVPVPDPPGQTPDATGRVDERALLSAALGRLSSSDRDVLVLRECEEWTFDELAALTGRSVNTLRQQAFRARRRLADAYVALGGRAGAVVWWLRRWRPPVPADVAAAVVVAGALVVTPAPSEPPPTITPVAGPVTPASSTVTRRAAPARPLQPARAARLASPRPAARPAGYGPAPRPARPSATPTAVGDARNRHEASPTPPVSEPVTCSLTPIC